MGLTEYSSEDLEQEKAIQEQLFQCCDTFESVVFHAGAGSGKTYALVECLKHIVNKNREKLIEHNQKIVCITYTNVAANHIKHQIGASDVVVVSTIHERIWSMIKEQKSALLALHVEKLKNEIKDIRNQLAKKPDFQKYKKLDQVKKQEFFLIMQENREAYYEAYSNNASGFKNSMSEIIPLEYKDLLSNVTKFKSLVDKLFKIERYERCLERIEAKEKEYRVVQYNAKYNRDRLDIMRISHDTVLEYGYQLIEKYPKMRQMIIDQYPYILIDEYQDTTEVAVKMMDLVEKYAKEINHDMFVGYFGDSVQNIYDDGIGGRLNELHTGLKEFDKIYNRRSYKEIIDLANKVRNDRIEQKSIYSDCEGGSAMCYYGTEADIKEFIDMCAENWDCSTENPLHCLFATNQKVAEYSGFLKMYIAFNGTDRYKKGLGYKQLNSELLGQDTRQLGRVPAMFDRLMRLYSEVRNGREPLRNILPTDDFRSISFSELRTLIQVLKSIDGENIEELLKKIFKQYEEKNDKVFKKIIDKVFDLEEASYNAVITEIAKNLYRDDWEESKTAEEMIRPILEIEKQELLNWFDYRNHAEKEKICYHTFHSTKGLEFENVAIILGQDFGKGKGKNLFETYFKEYGKSIEEISDSYETGRNILYVAVSRAIKNLCILYVDHMEDIQDKIEMIFGKIEDIKDGK
ncbi:UvrD-helicase domain-containing protein [[Clostridium] polysaccharolyticum]|uniref:DNA helicase-2 / ATP-dependent DNA helicase PcrA n=1 Tax=[Clostridium] polysaccharolyticum TaxID=29364 RepID=A0A1I0EV54_9FIRM|nr:UvrD-helicase domain-containing protein [[Clostridium] polysaccharolyticum]SET49488.1 DNA helicase-2 / ATP-dependent DNA helicase PcrA [[Clostridium] polysaccharolyticum]